ncbi:hypothetical protein M446_6047 [Methylobacterium sp. 4-46]|uniref:hypothetical protein n=1 Tax=unclassified Methylobacterium TaxID=2615210 RepID=UPI000165CC61|nr:MULTISPECIES: hypothetical protein [Methylobacterium]ACA20324.1 hypothetical protein M446_6047 [Methylobacterium sp. 4-46]WFT79498.1 hypothetical protein QA634_30510 [Methylobacterium nodulans]
MPTRDDKDGARPEGSAPEQGDPFEAVEVAAPSDPQSLPLDDLDLASGGASCGAGSCSADNTKCRRSEFAQITDTSSRFNSGILTTIVKFFSFR